MQNGKAHMHGPSTTQKFFRFFLPILGFFPLASLLLPQAALADDDADARQILKNVAGAYQKLQSYEFRATIEDIRGSNVTKRQAVYSGARTQKFRIEEQAPAGQLSISDGQNLWNVNRESKEFQKSALSPATRTPVSDLEEIDQHVKKAVIAREDLYEVNGKSVPVYVVMLARDHWPEGTPSGVYMASYRIDEQSFKVYGVNYYTQDGSRLVYYYISKWDQPVPDESFAFAPSDSIRAVTSIKPLQARATSQIGSEAPDFTLSDALGRQVHLQDLRGKVVIVDFWATWCPPCREQMPHLQQIHQQFSDKGVVVLGLDVGEDATSVSQFAQESAYTFTLLLGSEPSVTELYFVDGFPTTLVVDRQGKIVYRAVGGESPGKLQSAVRRALEGKS
jgi:peroxiredoxin/outer membrane lipoprotein-sorting protein